MNNQRNFRCREIWEMIYSGAGAQPDNCMSQSSKWHIGGDFLLKGSGPRIWTVQDVSKTEWLSGLFPTSLMAQHRYTIIGIHSNACPAYHAICPVVKRGSCWENDSPLPAGIFRKRQFTHINKSLCPLVMLQLMSKNVNKILQTFNEGDSQETGGPSFLHKGEDGGRPARRHVLTIMRKNSLISVSPLLVCAVRARAGGNYGIMDSTRGQRPCYRYIHDNRHRQLLLSMTIDMTITTYQHST